MDSSILNLALALDRVGGDRELLQEVAQVFLEASPELLQRVQKAVADRDSKALEQAAHALKGSVGNFAAEDVYQAAMRLEKMGRSGNLDGVEKALADLEAEMVRLSPALVDLSSGGPK